MYTHIYMHSHGRQGNVTGLPKSLTQSITEEEIKAGGAKLHGKVVSE